MSRIAKLIRAHEDKLLRDWMREQSTRGAHEGGVRESELRAQAQEFLQLLAAVLDSGVDGTRAEGPPFSPLRDLLSNLSRTRGAQGFSPSDTVHFILSVKRPLLQLAAEESGGDRTALLEEANRVNLLIDDLGVFTTEVHQKSREEVIRRQQSEMLELSTPVVKLWDGVLALPLIGTLDSQRTSIIMETLLQRIVDTNSQVAIIDITGVPTVDTLVAQHLIKTVAAARLMGAECIVSGVRPQIAQTIVHLGVDLSSVVTKATLADAFAVALRHIGLQVTKKVA